MSSRSCTSTRTDKGSCSNYTTINGSEGGRGIGNNTIVHSHPRTRGQDFSIPNLSLSSSNNSLISSKTFCKSMDSVTVPDQSFIKFKRSLGVEAKHIICDELIESLRHNCEFGNHMMSQKNLMMFQQQKWYGEHGMQNSMSTNSCNVYDQTFRLGQLDDEALQQTAKRLRMSVNNEGDIQFLNQPFQGQGNLTSFGDEVKLVRANRVSITSQDLNDTFFTGRFTRSLVQHKDNSQIRNATISNVDIGTSAGLVSRSSSSWTYHQPDDTTLLCASYTKLAATTTRNLSSQWLSCDYAASISDHHRNVDCRGVSSIDHSECYGGNSNSEVGTLKEAKDIGTPVLRSKMDAKKKTTAPLSTKRRMSAPIKSKKNTNGSADHMVTIKGIKIEEINTGVDESAKRQKVDCPKHEKKENIGCAVKIEPRSTLQMYNNGKKNAVYDSSVSSQNTFSASENSSGGGGNNSYSTGNTPPPQVVQIRTRPTFRELRHQSKMETLELMRVARSKLDSIQLRKVEELSRLDGSQVVEACHLIVLPPFPQNWPTDHLAKYDRLVTGHEASKVVSTNQGKLNNTSNCTTKAGISQTEHGKAQVCKRLVEELFLSYDEAEQEEEELLRCYSASFVHGSCFSEPFGSDNTTGSGIDGLNARETLTVDNNAKCSGRASALISPNPTSQSSYPDECRSHQILHPNNGNDDCTTIPIKKTSESSSSEERKTLLPNELPRNERRRSPRQVHQLRVQQLKGKQEAFRLQVVSPETTLNKLKI